MKSKGSVLQITLILFSALVLLCDSLSSKTKIEYQLYKNVDLLMKQKNVEILLMKYYIETMKNDFLISDCFNGDNYYIEYTIDDMWSYYIIHTYIEYKDISYGFVSHINTKDYSVTYFEYI